jgi:hypothetical protein
VTKKIFSFSRHEAERKKKLSEKDQKDQSANGFSKAQSGMSRRTLGSAPRKKAEGSNALYPNDGKTELHCDREGGWSSPKGGGSGP